jgi:WD40 repeat protein
MGQGPAGGIGGSDTVHTRGDGAWTAHELPPGTRIGGYEIEALAGRGGMGVVYRARDMQLGRTVALKVIGGDRTADPDRRAQFVRESLTAASIEHPNVLPIYQAGDDDGRLFIAMRFVEGASLAELIAAAPGGMPPGRAARIVARAADALDAAHSRRLVHRDVKPGNILIADPDGEEHVYLSDFGLTTGGDAVRGAGWTGTLAYLAPEQIRGDALDARTDVYALGCVLFHALTGRPPFTGDEAEVLRRHESARPPVPSEVVPGLPPALDEVVRRGMAKRPEDRYATAGELGRAALAARYDVALLVAPGDAAAAAALAAGLQASDVLPLVTAAGEPRAAEGVRASGACAVLVGRGGLGEWARDGLAAARAVADRDRAFRQVLVLLPGAPDPGDPALAYMADHPWVDLRAGAGDAHAAADVIRALRGAAVPAGLPADEGVAPYRGLEPFREEDAALYFGREQDVARVLERMRLSRFVAVIGPSGSGKSSLVQAGLLPALRREGAPSAGWRVLEMIPGARPLAALAAQLAHLPGAAAPSPADLGADERTLDVATAHALDGRPAGDRVLVLVDQLEEAFTLCGDEGERAAFLGNLVYAATIPGGRTVVVGTMRADFYHRLAEHPALRGLVASQQVLLGPLDARNLRRAIEEPARRCGLELEPGLTRRILTDVADRPGTLPLMEHVLLEIWQRRRGKLLTLEAYADSGGVEGALARRANAIYGAMSPERQAVARRVLLRLTQPGEGTEDTRRRATRAELVTQPGEEAEVDAVVGALAEARLLTTGTDEASGEPVVDVTHEALIRGWPELRGWINDSREQLRLERRLSTAATDWDAGGRDDGQLYRGAPLASWDGRDETGLNTLERAFLGESRERVERERATRRKRTRITIGALAAVAAVIAAIAVFAFIQRNDANDQRDTATSRQLAGSSTLARDRDPELATLLGERAFAAAPTVEAEESLRQSVHDSTVRAALRMPDELPIGAVPMPGGRMFVAAQSGDVRVWDAERDPLGQSAREVGTWPGGISALGSGPAGYLTGDDAGQIVLWPGRDAPGAPQRVAKVPGPVYRIRALPGGDQVIVAAEGGAYLVGLTDHRVQPLATGSMADAQPDPAGGYLLARPLNGLERLRDGAAAPLPVKGLPRALALSPDRTQLAVATDGGIEVVRAGAGAAPVFSAAVASGGNDVAWAPDGARVAVAGGGGGVQVYDRAGRLLTRLVGHEGSVEAIGWAGPTTVVSTGSDGSIRRWDVTAGVEDQLKGHTPSAFGGVSFTPDATALRIVRADGSVERWTPGQLDTQPLLPPVPPTPPIPLGAFAATTGSRAVATSFRDGRVIARDAAGGELFATTLKNDLAVGLAIDPDGRRLAIARAAGDVETVDLTPGAEPQVVGTIDGGAFTVAFSPSDGTLAGGGYDGSVKLWGGPGGDRTLGKHDGQVISVAFSPDGRWLASAGGDKTVRVWDVTGSEPPTVIRSHQGVVSAVTFAGNDRVVSAGDDAVRVTGWRRGVTLLTIPGAARTVTAAGDAPMLAFYGDDGVIHEIECDVCGPIDAVEAAAEQRTTRDLTDAEKTDFHVEG